MKSTIAGLGNYEKYNFLIFQKDKKLFSVIIKIIQILRDTYNPLGINDMIYGEYDELKIAESGKEPKKRDIKHIIDERHNFHGKDFNIDIIFGNKKVFVIGTYPEAKRPKIGKIIEKECKFMKAKPIKKLTKILGRK